MSKKSFIDSVAVGRACTEDWEKMSGNARVRFCSHCAKSVNNLSELTRKEAARFVLRSGNNICIRYIVDPVTRRPVFAKPLLQITRRTPRLAAGVMTASIGLSTAAFSQTTLAEQPVPAAEIVAAETPVTADPEKNSRALGSIHGTVTDMNGAVIPGAQVSYAGEARGGGTVTDENGEYRFEDLEPGKYRLTVMHTHFVRSVREITIGEDPSRVNADMALEVDGGEFSVNVKADVQLEVGTIGGAIVMVEYTSPLSQAIAGNDTELVRDLIVRGASVNSREESYSRITPLFVAVENGNIEIVRMLLDAGAKVNRRDESNQTPLMRLDSDATAELVELLVRYGAKVNLADDEGNTALILAAENAGPDVIKALIANGANVNAANKTGVTPLMNAADSDQIESVRALLIAGAEPNAKDEDGDNAWDYADSDEIEQLLEAYGAEADDPSPASDSRLATVGT